MRERRLFHISEEQGIERFEPRPAKSSHHKVEGKVVWAVGEARLYNYLVPRNCPRVSFFAMDSTEERDVELFLDGEKSKIVLAIESSWFDKLMSTRLVRYEFDSKNFYLFDKEAEYYLSKETEVPKSVDVIDDPLKLLLKEEVEVRIMSSLWELRERILKSSVGFSFIRMNNAKPPKRGYETYHPT